MSTSIGATSASTVTDNMFAKIDTKQKGYISQTDLQTAMGTSSADASASADLFKQLDTNSDGKVTKSELSAAIQKVGDQLNSQLTQSQTSTASTASTATGSTDGTHSAKAEAAHARRAAGGGAPPGKTGGSDTATTSSATSTNSANSANYTAAADTNSDGTVSSDEAAAFKKLVDAAKAQTQVQSYQLNSGTQAPSTSSSVNVSV